MPGHSSRRPVRVAPLAARACSTGRRGARSRRSGARCASSVTTRSSTCRSRSREAWSRGPHEASGTDSTATASASRSATLFDDVHHAVPREAHFVTRCRMLAAAALGYVIDEPPKWRFVPPVAVDGIPAERFAMVVHATSRADKLWPEDRWRDARRRLRAGGMAHAAAVGQRSGTRTQRADRARHRRRARAATTIAHALAGLLAKADVVVGVDTGLTHFAAALGTPTVAIFTQTDARARRRRDRRRACP